MNQTEIPLYLFHDGDVARMDDEIVVALEHEFEYTIGRDFLFEFNMAEDDFYDVLSIIDAHNAPALIQVGLRDKRSVRDFLLRYGLRHLIHNNAEAVETAKRSEVDITDYMELYSAARWSHKNAYDDLILALEKYKGLQEFRFCRKTVLPLIVRGLISYEDVEAVGYQLLERSSSNSTAVSALMALKETDQKVKLTAEHIRRALAGNAPSDCDAEFVNALERTRARVDGMLNLMLLFGGEEGLEFKQPAQVNHIIRQQWSTYRRAIHHGFACFVDELVDALELMVPAVAEMQAMYEAGVSPEFAIETIKKESHDWSVMRIIALHNGSASALTNGWL